LRWRSWRPRPPLPGSARAATWTQLTGVFDASHGTLTLYVNGVQRGLFTGVSPWSAAASGPMQLANAFPGTHAFAGRLSGACVFYGAVQAADVGLLYSGDVNHPHNGCAALFAKYP
jgi:hypothetical protein